MDWLYPGRIVVQDSEQIGYCPSIGKRPVSISEPYSVLLADHSQLGSSRAQSAETFARRDG